MQQLRDKLRKWLHPDHLQCVFEAWWCGFVDSLMLHKTLAIVLLSSKLQVDLFRCLLFNLVLFVGSIILAEYILFPLMAFFSMQIVQTSAEADASSGGDDYIADLVPKILRVLYYLLWIYPVYGLSLIFNSIWYQNIANHAYALRTSAINGKQPKPQIRSPEEAIAASKAAKADPVHQVLRSVSDQIYSLILLGCYLLQVAILSFIPFVGTFISGVYMSFLYSMYFFEYRWILEGKTSDERISYFENRWPYFLGFGKKFVLSCHILNLEFCFRIYFSCNDFNVSKVYQLRNARRNISSCKRKLFIK
jgi:etoposide-induced 2.4 mRNA